MIQHSVRHDRIPHIVALCNDKAKHTGMIRNGTIRRDTTLDDTIRLI